MAKRSKPSFTLQDCRNQSDKIGINVQSTGQFLSVSPEGCEVSPILIEYYNGQLRVVVYPNLESKYPKVSCVDVK